MNKLFFFGVKGSHQIELASIEVGSTEEAINVFTSKVNAELLDPAFANYGWLVATQARFPTTLFTPIFETAEHRNALLNQLAHIANGTSDCTCTFGPCDCYFDSKTSEVTTLNIAMFLDSSSVTSLVDEIKELSESVPEEKSLELTKLLFEFSEPPSEFITVERNKSATGASKLFITLKPTERFLMLVAAVRALGKGDGQ